MMKILLRIQYTFVQNIGVGVFVEWKLSLVIEYVNVTIALYLNHMNLMRNAIMKDQN
jgi:hypothetical protein